MKRFILGLFILIGFPLFSSSEDDVLAQQQMEGMLKGILVSHALATIDASPSRAFEDLVSVLPEHMHPPLREALRAHEQIEPALWQHSLEGDVFAKMALISLEELFKKDLALLIHQEGEHLYGLGKNKQALHVLVHIFPPNVRDFLEIIKTIKPYEEVVFSDFEAELDRVVLDDLSRVLIREKLVEKHHEHIYLRASNRLREMDHMGAIELFMQMLPSAIQHAMSDLLNSPNLRILSARQMCENFYQTHKKDLKHIQEQALVKATESAEKFLILSLDPYHYMEI